MGDHYTRGINRALAVWEIKSGGLEIGGFSLPSDPGNQPQGQGNPRGQIGLEPCPKPPPKKDPEQIRAVWRGAPPKRPNLEVVPGAKPPREGKKRKAKSISYNVGKSTQIHRPAIATDEKEARNAQTTKAIRQKPERRG